MRQEQLRRWLSRAGVQVRPAANVRPLDLTGESDFDPIAAVYQGLGRAVLLCVPLVQCRHFSWLAFPTDRDSASPFIRSLVEYASGRCRTYTGSSLQSFYRDFCPGSAAEFMGMTAPSYPGLAEVAAGGALKFWKPEDLEESVFQREQAVAIENRERGARFGSAEGDPFYGPVSARKGELEFNRLTTVFESIKRRGFEIDFQGFNNVTATCLYSDATGEWKYLIAIGQHRVAALAALGYREAVIQIAPGGLGGIVRRADAKRWPAVRAGYLSEGEATRAFDRIFAGEQPPAFQRVKSAASEEAGRLPPPSKAISGRP